MNECVCKWVNVGCDIGVWVCVNRWRWGQRSSTVYSLHAVSSPMWLVCMVKVLSECGLSALSDRRNVKYTSCTDNHGIRPPPPEQYLTPLQQKEVCIRHLRARLKETVDRLQDRSVIHRQTLPSQSLQWIMICCNPALRHQCKRDHCTSYFSLVLESVRSEHHWSSGQTPLSPSDSVNKDRTLCLVLPSLCETNHRPTKAPMAPTTGVRLNFWATRICDILYKQIKSCPNVRVINLLRIARI